MLIMKSHRLVVFCCLLCLAACDPETLVKEKVPEPIKDALTLGSGPAANLPLDTLVKIRSPKQNDVIAVGKEFSFNGEVNIPPEKPQPEITWTVKKLDGAAGDVVGKGKSFKPKSPLTPGKYTAELTAVLGEQKAIKKVPFAVAYQQPGSVKDATGAPLGNVAIELLDRNGQVKFSTKTRNDGSFSLEFPDNSEKHRLIARLKGYTFNPSTIITQLSDQPVKFSAYKGELSGILVTDKENTTAGIVHLCPSLPYYLAAVVNLENPVKSFKAYLHPSDEDSARPIPFQISSLPQIEAGAEKTQHIRIEAPTPENMGAIRPSYKVKVEIIDSQGNKFEGESNRDVYVDMKICSESSLKLALQQDTDNHPQDALKSYEAVQRIYRQTQDPSLRKAVAASYFNSGLIYLELGKAAVSTDQPGTSPTSLFKSALNSFLEVIRLDKKDGQAYFFAGLAAQGAGLEEERIVTLYSEGLKMDPDFTNGYELRGQALLKTKKQDAAIQAVMDFTKYLTLNPKDQEVRQIRKKALQLYADTEKKPTDRELAVDDVPLRDPLKRIDFRSYKRLATSRGRH